MSASNDSEYEQTHTLWEDPYGLSTVIRHVVRGERPHGFMSTPIVTIAEESISAQSYGRDSAVCDERDVVVLSVEQARWVINALERAIVFAGADLSEDGDDE